MASTKTNPRVAILLNYIPPYRLPFFKILAAKIGDLTFLLSTRMEPNRPWDAHWEGLNVILQHNIMIRTSSHHPEGFTDTLYIHLPYDTLAHLVRRRPDVVVSLELGFRTLQAFIYRLVFRSSRLIIWVPLSERTEQGHGGMRTILRRMILRNADAILVNGASGARYITQFGIPAQRIFTVPYTTDVGLFCSIPLFRNPEVSRKLLFIGQLIDRKGLIPFLCVLIRWCGLHGNQKVEFRVVGDGPVKSQLAGMILPENLTLILEGNTEYTEMPGYYTNAGLFVFPSLADEWGLVVNEAMLAGLPVLGSVHSQAVEEIVEDGVNGWKFTPDDSQSTLRAIDLAFGASRADLDRMRTQARVSAEKFSPEFAAGQVLAAIHSTGCANFPDRY
jgi:hypothetical protein